MYYLKIKELLRLKNISPEELGEKLNKKRATIYNYLNGKTSIDVETLQRISEILNVSINDFFTEGQFSISDLQKTNEQLLKRVQELEEQIKDKIRIGKLWDKLTGETEKNSTYFIYFLLSKHFAPKDIIEIMKSPFISQSFDITFLNKLHKIGFDKFNKENIKEYPSLRMIKDYFIDEMYNDLSKI